MTEVLVEQLTVSDAEDAKRRAKFPLGSMVTYDDLALAGHEPVIDALREAEPVSWCPGIDGWIVSSRSAVRQALRRGTLTVESSANMVRASLGRMLLTVDGEEHARLRRPVEWPFKPGTVEESYGAEVLQLVNELIDNFAADGEVELDQEFAAPFAVRMAGVALGLSLGDVAKIDGIYTAFANGMAYDGDPEPLRLADEAREQLNAILRTELTRNRESPGRSVTLMLVADSQGLTDDEIVAQLRVVMFGAIETIQASVLSTLYLLLTHPNQLAAVKADLSLLANAQEEARRLVPPVAFVERWTRNPVNIDGVDIPADSLCSCRSSAPTGIPGCSRAGGVRHHAWQQHSQHVVLVRRSRMFGHAHGPSADERRSPSAGDQASGPRASLGRGSGRLRIPSTDRRGRALVGVTRRRELANTLPR